MAAPAFVTTTPAAWFARRTASGASAPAARASEITPVTVSPAPVTSVTSPSPDAGRNSSRPSRETSAIPLFPRVITTFSAEVSSRIFMPAARAWPSESTGWPTISAASSSFGVRAVQPLNSPSRERESATRIPVR